MNEMKFQVESEKLEPECAKIAGGLLREGGKLGPQKTKINSIKSLRGRNRDGPY